MINKVRRRAPQLDIKARIRFATDPEGTKTVYRATVCELTSHGAMIMVDLPCSIRLSLFEKVRHCLLEFEDSLTLPDQVLGRAVWLQPQTSNGEFMVFKIGLSFVQVTPETAGRLSAYASR